MADGTGIYWFTDPGVIGQKMSARFDEIVTPQYAAEMNVIATKAANIMRERVSTGGLNGKIGRIETGDMLESIDGHAAVNSRSRVQAEFGYINNAPEYTKYQEYGTATTGWGGGIEALDAMNAAMIFFEDSLDQLTTEPLQNAWEGIWS